MILIPFPDSLPDSREEPERQAYASRPIPHAIYLTQTSNHNVLLAAEVLFEAQSRSRKFGQGVKWRTVCAA